MTDKPIRGDGVRPRRSQRAPAYPAPSERPHDPSRRRFLRQVAAAGGTVAVLGGLPAAAQDGPTPDFSILDGHAGVTGAAADAQTASGERRRARRDEQPADDPATVELVTENRALWVEPGYLVLLQWRRPNGDDAPVAALEGADTAVLTYLTTAVSDPATLHDVDTLTEIETGIVGLLGPLVAPAVIDVVHLDHDCTSVCGGVGGEPTRPIVRGRMAPPIR